MKNQRLIENPELGKTETSYILKRVQKANEKSLGKKQSNIQIKNTTDKAVVRDIVKRNKKR